MNDEESLWVVHVDEYEVDMHLQSVQLLRDYADLEVVVNKLVVVAVHDDMENMVEDDDNYMDHPYDFLSQWMNVDHVIYLYLIFFCLYLYFGCDFCLDLDLELYLGLGVDRGYGCDCGYIHGLDLWNDHGHGHGLCLYHVMKCYLIQFGL